MAGYLSDVWVGNYGDNSVSKISDGVVTTISNISLPRGICVDKNGAVWVTNFSSMTVSKIVNNVIVLTVNVGSDPWGICVDADNSIWVVNFLDSTVSKIVNGVVVATIAVGSYPIGICVDKNNVVWVANEGSNTVSKIVNGVVTSTISVGLQPYYLCADQNNVIWVSNFQGNGSVSKIDNDVVTATITSGISGPRGICVDKNNAVWVVNTGSGTASQMVNGIVIATISVGNSPIGICVDDNNTVWVNNQNSANVSEIVNGVVTNTVAVGSNPISAGDATGMQAAMLFGWSAPAIYSANSTADTSRIVSNQAHGKSDVSRIITAQAHSEADVLRKFAINIHAYGQTDLRRIVSAQSHSQIDFLRDISNQSHGKTDISRIVTAKSHGKADIARVISGDLSAHGKADVLRSVTEQCHGKTDACRFIAAQSYGQADLRRSIVNGAHGKVDVYRKIKTDLFASTKVESISISMSSSSTFDTVTALVMDTKFNYDNAMNVFGNYQGFSIDFVTERVRESRKSTGKKWTLSGRSDATDLFYRPVDVTINRSSPKASDICKAFGVVPDFTDFTPAYSDNGWSMGSDGLYIKENSVQAILNKLFSWSKGLGEREILIYQRGSVAYACERQRYQNTYDLSNYKIDSIEIDSQKLIRATEQTYAYTGEYTTTTKTSPNTPGSWIWTPVESDVPFSGGYSFGGASLIYSDGLLIEESNSDSVTTYEYNQVYNTGFITNVPFGDFLYSVLVKKTVIEAKRNSTTTYAYDTYLSSENHLANEESIVKTLKNDGTWSTESHTQIRYVPLGNGFFGQSEYDLLNGGVISTSISRGSPGGQASLYTVKQITGGTHTDATTTKATQTLDGIPLNYVTIPIAETSIVDDIINVMNKMNGRKEVKLTASLPGGDLIDARRGVVMFEGQLYYIESNTVSGSSTSLKRQSLSAVRWE